MQPSSGGYVVCIPKQIVERNDIENGDEVCWTDDIDGEGPECIPPSEL